MVSSITVTNIFLSICVVMAVPFDSTALKPRQIAGDAPFTQSVATYTKAVDCPQGIQGKAGGVVLLVHGTGSNGEESWGSGPYIKNLPNDGPGFDVCTIDLPDRALGDAQVSAEFVAGNVAPLAAKSKTGKIAIVTHSQGALNAQAALNYWPSTQALVSSFTPISGDFQGTTSAAVCGPLFPCAPSLFQQATNSDFIKALSVQGGKALVPTTSIFTREDEIIIPESGPGTTSLLKEPSAMFVSFAVQDDDVCGAAFPAGHLSQLTNSPAYFLTLDALMNGGLASAARLPAGKCDDVGDAAQIAAGGAADAAAIAVFPKVLSEPDLKAYVCDRGDAKKCDK